MTPEIQIMCRQHDALREVVIEYLNALAAPQPDIAALSLCRWKLIRLVSAHLAFEDAHLYRDIARRGEPAASLGHQMVRESGNLLDSFHAHAREWTPVAIARDWQGFRSSAKRLLTALNNRMNREEQDLYPLIVGKAA